MADPGTWVIVAAAVTLHKALARAIGEASSFKSKLKLLENTVKVLLRKLKEIDSLSMVKLFPSDETDRLRQILLKGADLASTCSDISWWNYRKKRKYVERIDELDQSLQRFMSIDLQLQQHENILRVLSEVIQMNKKLEHELISHAAGSTGNSTPGHVGYTDGNNGNINGEQAYYVLGTPAGGSSRCGMSFMSKRETNCNCFCF